MKKLIKKLALLFLLKVLLMPLIGCQKENILPDPTLTVSVSKTKILENETVTFNWNSSNANEVDLISNGNSTKVDLNGSITTAPLTSTTTFTFTATSLSGRYAGQRIVITVTSTDLTLSVTASPSTIACWDSTAVIVESANADSVTSDLKIHGLSGTFYTPRLTTTTTYHFDAYQKGKVLSQAVTITVNPPTRLDYLCRTGWKLVALDERPTVNDSWIPYTPDSHWLAEVNYFHKDGTFEIFNGDTLTGNGSWNFLSSDSLNWGGDAHIDTLTILKLQLTGVGECVNCSTGSTMIYRFVYVPVGSKKHKTTLIGKK